MLGSLLASKSGIPGCSLANETPVRQVMSSNLANWRWRTGGMRQHATHHLFSIHLGWCHDVFFSPPSLEKKYCSSKNQHPRTSTLLTWWVGFRPPKTWEQEGTRSPQTGEPDSPAVRIWSRSSFPNHRFTQEIFTPRLKDMHIATISFLWISSLCRELQSLQEKKMVELVSGSIWSCTGCAGHGHPAASQHSSASALPNQKPTWSGHIRRPGDQSTQLGEGFISFGSGGLACFLRGGSVSKVTQAT